VEKIINGLEKLNDGNVKRSTLDRIDSIVFGFSGNAKDINIQNANNTDTNYSKHKKIKISLAGLFA
jgi:hypothetical protein